MFSNTTVWITGASSGIGEAFAKKIVTDGASLILSARNEAELNRVKGECQALAPDAKILVLPMDVTDEASMPAKVEAAKNFTGRIDYLFNNAGISQRSLAVDTTMDTYRKLFEVDVFGQIALTKLVLPIMINQGSGHMMVTASVAGKIGVPYRTGYCAAKHAMMGFFDALRAEVAGNNIKVTTITPGFIQTNISKNALKGDGTEFGRTDTNIATGMPVDTCIDVILAKMKKGEPEILVAQGKEAQAVWLKRFFPKALFKAVVNMGKPT
ncbi:oxidoreductase [Kordiimonas sediminis]|uniref:Oxidoreductase n=1 Tax=Kordiimonas sediminis TaxID=1735581 RepID=A0A919ATX6_9PROT|nr:SDR family oxidoreductase [Kordiimonas sediminis]GHF23526.1 oxidoreductase [Kordiimonas sediminis]